MTEGVTTAELDVIISRCLAGYPEANALKIILIREPDKIPNWNYSVEYEGSDIAGAGDVLVRDIADLKHRFHLLADE